MIFFDLFLWFVIFLQNPFGNAYCLRLNEKEKLLEYKNLKMEILKGFFYPKFVDLKIWNENFYNIKLKNGNQNLFDS